MCACRACARHAPHVCTLFVFAVVSTCVLYMYSDQILAKSCMFLFTEISVCKFLHGLAVVWPEVYFVHWMCQFRHFSAFLCTARHCALDYLASDHVS